MGWNIDEKSAHDATRYQIEGPPRDHSQADE